MKILSNVVYEGRNIYSHRKCVKLEVDLEGYAETPSKDIKGFNSKLVELLPELKTHRCGIDEEGGFVKRLNEGTYLAHICEHIIIAIHNKLGMDIAYGKAREKAGEIYLVVFEYDYRNTALEIASLAVDLINSLISSKDINYDDRIDIIKEILSEEMIGPSTQEVCRAAKVYNMPVIKLGNSGFYQIGYGKQGRIIEASISSGTNCTAVDISCDKLLTKELLAIQNLPIARGRKVSNIINLLKTAEDIGYPVVLKPQFGNKGKGVILNIRNNKELLFAYEALKDKYNSLILEEYYEGNDYRVCIINNEVVAVAKRIPPYVVGDGISTIKELIEIENKNPLRGANHEKPLSLIEPDISYINRQGYSLVSVLDKGVKIKVRQNANLSTGGSAIDYTDNISEENKEICIRAAKTIGLDICGIDVCCNDISSSLYEEGIIMEVNASPGLRMHLFPTEGCKRDIGSSIINMIYDYKPVNIPVVSITGTNGKTTTTRIINNTLLKMGYCTGMTSTDGIYINGKCVDTGDDTGADSARCVLLNKDVEIAVLETARGGIIKKGLAYDLADVAIITNITEDHIGCNDIRDMEDLVMVKSLVGESVKRDGYVVINADDKWSIEATKRITANIIYFSMNHNNKYIKSTIEKHGTCVYIKDNYIYVNSNGNQYEISKISDIPITLGGILEFNIENAMAACGALVGLGIDYSMIKIGLQSFELNEKDNSGRFNMYDCKGVNVILDYGHNIEGYKKVLSSLKNISKNKIIGVIGMPGDRSDHDIKQIGILSSKFLDKIIIKEDLQKRGRKTGEVSEIIKEAVTKENSKIDCRIILNEVEALQKALQEAERGDTVIVFFEKLNPLIQVIKAAQCEEMVNNLII